MYIHGFWACSAAPRKLDPQQIKSLDSTVTVWTKTMNSLDPSRKLWTNKMKTLDPIMMLWTKKKESLDQKRNPVTKNYISKSKNEALDAKTIFRRPTYGALGPKNEVTGPKK